MPSYEPRAIPIPAECDALLARAGKDGALEALTEAEARKASFCQHQQMLRAQEEQSAARKLEAHTSAARFALQATTVVVGSAIAVLAWLF